jgi:hypothetical protein
MRHLALHNENSSYSTIPIAAVGRREREVLLPQRYSMLGVHTRCVESPCGALYNDARRRKYEVVHHLCVALRALCES